MSLRSWLFGDEVEFLRGEIEKQRAWFTERIKTVEASNTRLREEIVTLADAGAMAQVQAYRERKRAPVMVEVPPNNAPVAVPPDIARMLNLQDAFATGVMPDDASDTDEEIERQVQAREAARIKAYERELASMDFKQEG